MLQKKCFVYLLTFMLMFSFTSAVSAEEGLISLNDSNSFKTVKRVVAAASGASIEISIKNDSTSGNEMNYSIISCDNDQEKAHIVAQGTLKPGGELHKEELLSSGNYRDYSISLSSAGNGCTGSWELTAQQLSCYSY